jgi:hypothetical protein
MAPLTVLMGCMRFPQWIVELFCGAPAGAAQILHPIVACGQKWEPESLGVWESV